MSTLSWRVLRLPLLLTLLWCLLLFALFRWTVQREDEYATGLARIQTQTLLTSIVDTREWNAINGGVWVREHPGYPPNQWLPEEERTLRAENGQLLIKINPAYMTRQIAEIFSSPLASFRISGLSPKRPGNRADPWEAKALFSFEQDQQPLFELTPGKDGMLYRYMAPLSAKESCLQCHQQNKVGDILGGISVSISAEPFLEAAAARKRTTGLAFGLIGLIGVVGIGGATFQINRKRELAEAANRAKSAFLANMTHDMRTPLTGIAGMAELLERETRDAHQHVLLANLKDAADSLLTLVDGIMRYSLLEADRRPAPCTPFSLRAELGDCIATLRPACASRNIRLALIADESVPDRLRGDGFRLRQAIGNLLGNAVKFTEKGSVTLRVSRKGTELEGHTLLAFQIIDTGRGIPQEAQERIFECFKQGLNPETRGKQPETGVGLGLAIARTLARRFHGDLTLSSTPGMGSVFTFTAQFRLAEETDSIPEASPLPESVLCLSQLPQQFPSLSQAAPSAEAKRGPESPAREGCGRLLIAEDSPVTALFLKETLTQAGYAVRIANTGEETLHAIRDDHPEAVLLDIRLPDRSGLDIARQIRAGELEIASDTPILVLSATISPAEDEILRRMAINGWTLKPIRADKLVEMVSALFVARREEPGLTEEAGAQEEVGAQEVQMPEKAADVFDPEAALEELGNEALLRRLATIFLSEEANIRTAFQTFVQSPETLAARHAELRRQAHSLKNGAGMLHLNVLRTAASELEQAAANPAGQDFPALLHTTLDALDRASEALRLHCEA